MATTTRATRAHALPLVAVAAAVALAASSPAPARGQVVVTKAVNEPPSVGVGAILGDPTALSLKLRLAENHAFQLYAGWGYIDAPTSRLTLMGDYLFHFIAFEPRIASAGILSPYVGIGGLVGFRSSPGAGALGARVPLGLSFLIRDAPVEIFAELGIGVLVLPIVAPMVQAGLGARYYF